MVVSTMNNLTAVINPQNPGEALLFYPTTVPNNATSGNLAMEQRVITPGPKDTIFNDRNLVNGPISTPGNLAAVVHSNTTNVYGITTFTGGDSQAAQIVSQISPVFNPIDKVAVITSKATVGPNICTGAYALSACSNGTDTDWVTFTQIDPTSGLPQIVEYQINANDTSGWQGVDSQHLSASSQVSSCLLTEKKNVRWMFWQDSKNNIHYTTSDSPQNMATVAGTSGALGGTALATAAYFNPTTKTTDVYLFFQDNNNNLNQVLYTASAGWSTVNLPAIPVSPTTDMSAVISGQNIYLFCYGENQSTITFKEMAITSV